MYVAVVCDTVPFKRVERMVSARDLIWFRWQGGGGGVEDCLWQKQANQVITTPRDCNLQKVASGGGWTHITADNRHRYKLNLHSAHRSSEEYVSFEQKYLEKCLLKASITACIIG